MPSPWASILVIMKITTTYWVLNSIFSTSWSSLHVNSFTMVWGRSWLRFIGDEIEAPSWTLCPVTFRWPGYTIQWPGWRSSPSSTASEDPSHSATHSLLCPTHWNLTRLLSTCFSYILATKFTHVKTWKPVLLFPQWVLYRRSRHQEKLSVLFC